MTSTKPAKLKITVAELKAFRETLPEYKRKQMFQFFYDWFDVDKAQLLVQKCNLTTEPINVKEMAQALRIDHERGSKFVPLLSINIKDEYVEEHLPIEDKQINVEEPLIFVINEVGKGKDKKAYRLLIDGNHRLRKAFLLGVETLPAYQLNEEQSKLVKCR